MSKNIVVFSDGTGQVGGKGYNTNVYQTFNLILDRSPQQVSFYDKGLGTGWRKLTGNAAGRGFSKNVLQGYQFIFENYQAGDQIFLFGFSRGAATVRSLTGFIHLFGILPRSRGKLIDEAWKIYKISNREKRKAKAEAFVARNHTIWTSIEFLGVWDTVAALGVPNTGLDRFVNWFIPHGFHDFTLSKSVRNAYHALAIDDVRKTFHPVLFDKDVGEGQTLKQVWFMGMHTDVGGGYPEQELSDIALEWMMQHAVKHGLHVYNDPHRTEPSCTPNPNGFMHDSRDKLWKKKIFPKKPRRWESRCGTAVIHESVNLRTVNEENRAGDDAGYAPWILKENPDVEPWTHVADWKNDPAYAHVEHDTWEALRGWCKPKRPADRLESRELPRPDLTEGRSEPTESRATPRHD